MLLDVFHFGERFGGGNAFGQGSIFGEALRIPILIDALHTPVQPSGCLAGNGAEVALILCLLLTERFLTRRES